MQHGKDILSVEELRDISRTAQARVTFSGGIPALTQALETVRTQLHDFEQEIELNSTPIDPTQAAAQKPSPRARAPAASAAPAPVPPQAAVPATSAAPTPAPVVASVAPPPATVMAPAAAPPAVPSEVPPALLRRKPQGGGSRRRWADSRFSGRIKAHRVRAKPSHAWRDGDDCGCPKDEDGEGGCWGGIPSPPPHPIAHGEEEGEEYTPYPKWWKHPMHPQKSRGKVEDKGLGFALPTISSYVHQLLAPEEEEERVGEEREGAGAGPGVAGGFGSGMDDASESTTSSDSSGDSSDGEGAATSTPVGGASAMEATLSPAVPLSPSSSPQPPPQAPASIKGGGGGGRGGGGRGRGGGGPRHGRFLF